MKTKISILLMLLTMAGLAAFISVGCGTKQNVKETTKSQLSVVKQPWRAFNGKSRFYQTGKGIVTVDAYFQVPSMSTAPVGQKLSFGPSISRNNESYELGRELQGGIQAEKLGSGAWSLMPFARIYPNAPSVTTTVDVAVGHWIHVITTVVPVNCSALPCNWRGEVTVVNLSTGRVWAWTGAQALYPPAGSQLFGTTNNDFVPTLGGMAMWRLTDQVPFFYDLYADFSLVEDNNGTPVVTDPATHNWEITESMLSSDGQNRTLVDSDLFQASGMMHGTWFHWHLWL